MKISLATTATGVLLLILFCSGCTSTPPQGTMETSTPTPLTTTAIPTTVPTLAAAVYPDALAVGQYANFGSGIRVGKGTVYRSEIKPSYTWTAPSFNSPREQAATALPNEILPGYNLEKPKEGNTFLFVYVRLINTGSTAVYAPSPSQFVVYADGKLYNYSSVHGPDVVIDGVFGTQYDYQIGTGGVVGYIQPGDSNKAEGYLIYEVPAAISLRDTYVLIQLDYQNQGVWRLG